MAGRAGAVGGVNDNRNGWNLLGQVIGKGIALALQGFLVGLGIGAALIVMGVA